jgi:hypothetical protein
MNRIVTKYKKCQSDIALTAHRVVEKMPNNPDFPDPPYALEELTMALPEFQSALALAAGRDKHLVSIKNSKKIIVLELLEELIQYVTAKSNGNRTIILSSGFDANRERRKTGSDPSIEILEVELGASGEATITARNVIGTRAYAHQYTTEPPGPHTEWISIGSSVNTYTFRGLTSEKRYWFRVTAIGSRNRTAYSPIVSRVIQ